MKIQITILNDDGIPIEHRTLVNESYASEWRPPIADAGRLWLGWTFILTPLQHEYEWPEDMPHA